MTRKTFVASTLAVGLVGLSVSATASFHLLRKERRTAAVWKDHFTSLRQMIRSADAVVLARAEETRPGRVAYSANGEDALSFEVTEFTVVDGLKGASDGQSITVERAGGGSDDGASIYFDADGGEFEPGATYVLFLNRGDGGHYFQLNDQGRFRVEGGRTKAAVDAADEVASTLHGRSLSDAVRMLRRGGE